MSELYHFGVKGMRWGVRRYQDQFGRLTPAGRRKRDLLTKKGDTAYDRGNINKAGKYYAKAQALGGESVSDLQGRYRRTASAFRKQEIDSRTNWDKKTK